MFLVAESLYLMLPAIRTGPSIRRARYIPSFGSAAFRPARKMRMASRLSFDSFMLIQKAKLDQPLQSIPGIPVRHLQMILGFLVEGPPLIIEPLELFGVTSQRPASALRHPC